MNNLSFLVLVVLLAIATTRINSLPPNDIVVQTNITGRLLTVEEGCGYVKMRNNRIVGGGDAKEGAYPWMAALFGCYCRKRCGQCRSPAQLCGGSIITTRHILTAAHCMYQIKMDFARIGSINIAASENAEYKDVNIVHQVAHRGHRRNRLTNDVAIVILQEDVTFTNRISPICMPDGHTDLQNSNLVDKNPFIAGWGRKQEEGARSNILQFTQVPVISIEKCKEPYLKFHDERYTADQFDDRLICAGYSEGGHDSCGGDSGGPLMFPHLRNFIPRFFQIGIVSAGHDKTCARANIPGVYTFVGHYIDWIKWVIDGMKRQN